MTTERPNTPNIAFLGFGEAANAFVSGWAPDDPSRIAAYDIKTGDPTTSDAMHARFAQAGVTGGGTPDAALSGVALVFSVVTAEQALAAAKSAASSRCFVSARRSFDGLWVH